MLALALTLVSLLAPSAREAFETLGNEAGVTFAPANGWAAAAEAELPAAGTFWQRFQRLSVQSGYEPIFEPYGDPPTIALRRVDVQAEEIVREAIAGDPLYARPRRVVVSRTPDRARLNLSAAQVALEVELFIDPQDAWRNDAVPDHPVAVYATAAGLKSEGRVTLANGRPYGLTMRRAAEVDPSVSLRGGVGVLTLRFDADERLQYAVPERFGPWRALARVVYADRWGDFGRELSPGEVGEAITRDGITVAVERFDVRDGDTGRRASLVLSLPKGKATSLGDWLRLYGFLQAIPPTLLGPNGVPWRRTSAIVYGVLDQADRRPDGSPNPLSSREWRVVSGFAEADDVADAEGAFRLVWSLPTAASERRVPLVWRGELPVTPPVEAP